MQRIVYETKGKTQDKAGKEHNEKKAGREERYIRTVWSKERLQ